jgi:hypothetical protein
MIVYVNGDSHSAAAEAAVPYAFAEDDPFFWGLGRKPHPYNERVSYGCEIANAWFAVLWCDAESASSNSRILRTTQHWIDQQDEGTLKDSLLVLQWSTWEREEWLDDGTYYQVNASGIDHVPDHLQQRYKEFIANIDWNQCIAQWHEKIWDFHNYLKHRKIRHLMFNGNSCFNNVNLKYDWSNCFIGPYEEDQTYDSVLRQNGFETVNPESYHFGAEAHCFWANFVLQYINQYNI